MKKLRNFYFIMGLSALAFALLTKHIPGVTITDFVHGFCHGLSITMFIAGFVTSTIPYFYRNEKKKGILPAHGPEAGDGNTTGTETKTETGATDGN